MKAIIAVIASLAVLLIATAMAAAPAPAPLLLTGARVLDPSGDRLLDGRDVLIEDGRIARIAAAGTIQAQGAQRIDLAGLTLIPGLIELHSHLLLHPYNETSWDDQVLKEPLELRTIRGVVAAKATLEAGFTTVRDLGTEGAGFADVALRDAIASGMIPGPRVFTSTRALVATGSYGPAGFDPRWDIPKGAQVVDGPDAMRKAVREQIAAGADWIKVYADYRRRPGGPSTPTFSLEELQAAVDEAKTVGLPVASHANTEEGIRRSVMAGVATIEHGSGATDELLALMKRKGVALCPTLAASEAISRYGGWKPGEPEPPRVRDSREMFVRALKSGVTLANGSDVGVFAHGENVRELELMVAYGMSAKDALRAATSTAAAVLRQDKSLGRLAPGYLADLVAVKGNPLEDVSVLAKPVLVVKDGRIALDQRVDRR